ncbi:hypothetical protein NVP1148O_62 [Vibrio phage 1.148.O._10N.286.54.A10]|nr:hypothetical protein NVP1148O_62 [Vibrio phage 1.148.O._10N.286.54.A10]
MKTKYKYEKVTGSVFGLKDDFQRGELWWLWDGNYGLVDNEIKLLSAIGNNSLYRRVEIDPALELAKDFAKIDSPNYEWHALNNPTKGLYITLARHAIDKLGSD